MNVAPQYCELRYAMRDKLSQHFVEVCNIASFCYSNKTYTYLLIPINWVMPDFPGKWAPRLSCHIDAISYSTPCVHDHLNIIFSCFKSICICCYPLLPYLVYLVEFGWEFVWIVRLPVCHSLPHPLPPVIVPSTSLPLYPFHHMLKSSSFSKVSIFPFLFCLQILGVNIDVTVTFEYITTGSSHG